MARFEGPPNSAHRPATTPVEGPHGRWPTVVAVLVLAGVTFMVGLHLGEAGVSPSVVLPSGSVQGSPAPTITPPPVQPDAVSSALANAAGGIAPRYGWAICVVDATPICQSIGPVTVSYNDFAGTAGPLSSPSARLAALWQAVPALAVVGTHLVLVAALTAPAHGALVARVDGRDANQIVPAVEPGRHGLDYFDLGDLAPGQYLIAVLTQVYGSDTSTPAPSAVVSVQVVGVLVCPSGLPHASPDCTFAP